VGEFTRAADYWKRAIEVNPWMARYWYGLAQAQAGSRQWQACWDTAMQASERFPTSIGARQLLVESNLQLGRSQAAQQAFDWLKRFSPRGMEQITRWYEAHPLRD
ncbi:MAG: hypothetical protein AAF961_05110, partial [Planctomycetota bacterium]